MKNVFSRLMFWALLEDLVGDAVYAWLFMLAVGIARANWLPNLPTIGFWLAFLLTFMLRTGHHYHSVKTAERVAKGLGLQL